MTAMRRVLAIALLCGSCGVHPGAAAERYDPRLRFRTLSTRSFSIHFHQGEEVQARRVAAIAEEVAARVAGELGRPNGRVHVILVDQDDLANGWANPIPYNVIEITAAAPPGSSQIGNTDDWLRVVLSHEYTHIVHLDKARGWIGGLRNVFGRAPFLYPNVFLPLWQIEGIATWNESVLTGQGRVPTGDFRFILNRAASAHRFEPLDRVNGGLVDWPGGTAHYAYGAYFHEYLANRFGSASIARLAEDTSGRVPYFSAPAFKRVFGRSLGDLWKDFSAETTARTRDQIEVRTQLTRQGFTVTAPAFGGSGRLFYAVADPHGFPALMELGRTGAGPRRVADRFLGNRTSALGSLLVFDQIEFERNVAFRSDLFAVDADNGHVHRLTRDARAADPDVSRDGSTIVCTVQVPGGRALALLPLSSPLTLGTPKVLIGEGSTDFSAPRWSPDGRSIAAERRRLNGPSEIVVVDVASRAVRTLVASRDARNVTPFWMPDGRAIVFASDRNGEPFAIYSIPSGGGPLRRLEGTGSGVQSPVVSPDGGEIVFVGYTVAGYELFSLPLATATWREVPSALPAQGTPAASGPIASASTPYRPWGTLLPRFWMPVLASTGGELSAGAATAGADALGRHNYAATVTWAATRARPDWSVSYAYDRWRPVLFANASDDTDPWRDGDVRTQEFSAGALFTHRRVRYALSTLTAFDASTDQFNCALCPRPVAQTIRRRAIHLGWRFSNAQTYGYSISRESGAAFRTTLESAPEAFGSDATTGAVAADLRAYIATKPRHAVIAVRAAGASSSGDHARRRQFSASGSGPQMDGFDIGTEAIGLLRGFDAADVVGQHAAVVNVDVRVPLGYVQRGLGTLPVFLRSIHGAVFADIGNAWNDAFHRADVRRSFGAEISADSVLGYAVPVTFTSGVAWRDDPVTARGGWAVFGRVGRAF